MSEETKGPEESFHNATMDSCAPYPKYDDQQCPDPNPRYSESEVGSTNPKIVKVIQQTTYRDGDRPLTCLYDARGGKIADSDFVTHELLQRQTRRHVRRVADILDVTGYDYYLPQSTDSRPLLSAFRYLEAAIAERCRKLKEFETPPAGDAQKADDLKHPFEARYEKLVGQAATSWATVEDNAAQLRQEGHATDINRTELELMNIDKLPIRPLCNRDLSEANARGYISIPQLVGSLMNNAFQAMRLINPKDASYVARTFRRKLKESGKFDGVFGFYLASVQELKELIEPILNSIKEFREWNISRDEWRSGVRDPDDPNRASFHFTSRYDPPSEAGSEFIDLGAIIHNVAHDCVLDTVSDALRDRILHPEMCPNPASEPAKQTAQQKHVQRGN
jgi:hypothetical protein